MWTAQQHSWNGNSVLEKVINNIFKLKGQKWNEATWQGKKMVWQNHFGIWNRDSMTWIIDKVIKKELQHVTLYSNILTKWQERQNGINWKRSCFWIYSTEWEQTQNVSKQVKTPNSVSTPANQMQYLHCTVELTSKTLFENFLRSLYISCEIIK